MQSFISQISNLFAKQSLDSIENSELPKFSATDTGFGGLLESFSEGNNTANIAALYGNSLQASHTPVSIQITQFALTAQPAVDDASVEYTGQIVSTKLSGNPLDARNSQYVSTTSQEYRTHNQASYNSELYNHSLSKQPVTADNDTALPVANNLSANNVNRFARQENLFDESSVNHQINPERQQANRVGDTNLLNQNIASKSLSDTNIQDDKIENNINTIVSDRPAVKQGNNDYLNEGETKNASLINNVPTPAKPLQQAPALAPVDEKLPDNLVNTNSVAVDNKILVTDLENPEESVLPVLKDNTVAKSVLNDDKASPRSISPDVHKNDNAVQNSSVTTATEYESTVELSRSKTELGATKPVYNPVQQNEVNKTENNARDLAGRIKSGAIDQNNYADNGSRPIHRNDANLDVSPFIEGQEITKDVKLTPNNLVVDKPGIQSSILTGPLDINHKVSNPERPTLQLNSSNEIGNGNDLAQHIAWAKNNNANNIKIAISPEHLGALEINIENDADGLNIQFVTQNSTAKDAIETFMPRLKDMLEQNGLTLQNANVSHQDKGQNNNASYSDASQLNGESVTEENLDVNNEAIPDSHSVQTHTRLLEAFA